MGSGLGDNEACKLRNGCLLIGYTKPVAEIMPEGKPKLFAGLHKAQHGIAGNAPLFAHCATRDLAFGDAAAQIALGRVGVQRNFRAFENLE